MKVLVFDTETTGLQVRGASIYDKSKWPCKCLSVKTTSKDCFKRVCGRGLGLEEFMLYHRHSHPHKYGQFIIAHFIIRHVK